MKLKTKNNNKVKYETTVGAGPQGLTALLAAAALLTDPTQIAGNTPSDRRPIGSGVKKQWLVSCYEHWDKVTEQQIHSTQTQKPQRTELWTLQGHEKMILKGSRPASDQGNRSFLTFMDSSGCVKDPVKLKFEFIDGAASSEAPHANINPAAFKHEGIREVHFINNWSLLMLTMRFVISSASSRDRFVLNLNPLHFCS